MKLNVMCPNFHTYLLCLQNDFFTTIIRKTQNSEVNSYLNLITFDLLKDKITTDLFIARSLSYLNKV